MGPILFSKYNCFKYILTFSHAPFMNCHEHICSIVPLFLGLICFGLKHSVFLFAGVVVQCWHVSEKNHNLINFYILFLLNITCSEEPVIQAAYEADLNFLAFTGVLLLQVCWLLPRTLCRIDRVFFFSSSRASSSSAALPFTSESQVNTTVYTIKSISSQNAPGCATTKLCVKVTNVLCIMRSHLDIICVRDVTL